MADADDQPAVLVSQSDLDVCDREPIHIPGSIQPYGLLLVVDEAGVVVGAAGDVEQRLSPDWFGVRLADLIGTTATQALDRDEPAMDVTGRAETFDAVAHTSGAYRIVELEPSPPDRTTASRILAQLNNIGLAFERATGLKQLCERAAEAFQEITGFERVMIYRFLDDGSGVVLGEAKAADLGSFLNHHFPASDVPKQARALYIRNRIRVIADAGYAPAPLRSPDRNLAALDLSDAALRSVSPVHLQYLRNMAVVASCSVSIVKDGLLWGLVACHDRQARRLPYDVRMAAKALAGGFARQIRAKDEADTYRDRLRVRASEDIALAKLADDATDLPTLFRDAEPELSRMLSADGFAAVQGDETYVAGKAPPAKAVKPLAAWALDLAAVHPLQTDELSSLSPAAAAYREDVSGLLAVRLETDPPTLLMWFRAETLQVVKWAGDPHKGVPARPGEVLTPRASFEAWSETVRGRAKTWTVGEVEGAGRFAQALFERRQLQEVKRLNRSLQATNAANERLLVQKDLLMREVSHRVQNSLQLVSAFLSMQARAADDERLSQQLDVARSRIAAVALVHRRLYADDRIENIDLARYVEDLVDELKASMDPAWRSQFTLDLAPILISADRAVNIGLILTELVINANKYAYGGSPGPIAVALEEHQGRFRLIVADRGRGRTGEHEGFGSRLLRAMVDSVGGQLDDGANAPGLRVILTAPIGA